MRNIHPEDRGLLWIGGFKLLMGFLLAAVATGVLYFVHSDLITVAEHWVDVLHFDPENGYVVELMEKLGMVEDRQLQQLSGLSYLYAGLLLAEGVGLMRKKRWAEYLTVVVTASLIPLELYEVLARFGFGKVTLLVVNVGIVWYLIRALRRQRNAALRSPA
jgi:uncharacterized membrane protein (DUF2068 family)